MKTTISQRQAVLNAVTEVLAESGLTINPEVATVLTKDELTIVKEAVIVGIMEGLVEYKSAKRSEADIRKYVPGMINDAFRKDKRLNGGIEYETKNPGSRAGAGDSEITEMRKLLKVVTDPAHLAAIQAEIDAKLALKTVAKTKKVEIDVNKLPESIRHLIGK